MVSQTCKLRAYRERLTHCWHAEDGRPWMTRMDGWAHAHVGSIMAPIRDRMAMPPCCYVVSPSTTPQSVLSLDAHRTPVTGVCNLRRSCDGNRRTPLRGESERMRAQSGHSTKAMPLSANRLRSMATTPANVHLDDGLGGTWASTVCVVFCGPFARRVSC